MSVRCKVMNKEAVYFSLSRRGFTAYTKKE